MNDLEIMIRARQYIDSLANGRDPLTGENLPESDIVNNVRISRCLFYVSGVLQKVIDNGGEIVQKRIKKSGRAEFSLTPEQSSHLIPEDDDLFISKVAKIINAQIDESVMKKLKASTLNDWLVQKGLLSEVIINGRTHRDPTPAGEQLGITLISYVSPNGMNVKNCVYSPEAQQFIFDNIDVIAGFAAGDENTDTEE